ncbi:hypothetical protein [Peptoniphilus asaccharolyticus]
MFILELYQDGMSTELGLFDTIEEGRKFVSQLKGYKFEEIDGFEYETIKLDSISDYMELEINGNIVPLTKFMFTEDGDVEVYWKEIPNLSKKGKGIVEGATRVDAYTVANSDLREYIEARENNYLEVKKNLEKKGYQVERAYFGSEDGEAILFRKKDSEDWRFLTHMDPEFTEEFDLDECLEMVEEDN